MRTRLTLILIAAFVLCGCRSAVYDALETFGVEKRDVLVNRVGAARNAQEAAKEQFASALEQFRSVVDVDATDLERLYDRLNRERQRSESRAGAVRDRIDTVEQVAEDLFDEWENELARISHDGGCIGAVSE